MGAFSDYLHQEPGQASPPHFALVSSRAAKQD